jgi:phytoene/squalene synthetase
LLSFCSEYQADRQALLELYAFNRKYAKLNQNTAENLAMTGKILAQWMRGDASSMKDEFEFKASEYHNIHNSCNGAQCDKFYRDLAKSAW